MGHNCAICGTELYHINEACPNCMAGSYLCERPPTFPQQVYPEQKEPEYPEPCQYGCPEIDTLRAENERLRQERDRLARRMRVLELKIHIVPEGDGTFSVDCFEAEHAVFDLVFNSDAVKNNPWPTAAAALDAAAEALEAAGLLEERHD